MEIFQKIARGANRVGSLLNPKDLTSRQIGAPARFELEVELDGKLYVYEIAFELPSGFKELRVFEEKLSVDNRPIFSRKLATLHLARSGSEKEVQFGIDWHLVALPIVQLPTNDHHLSIFTQWLAKILILRPIPSLIMGHSQDVTLNPDSELKDFAAWWSGLIANTPSAYGTISDYLKQVMPDLDDITNPLVGTDSRSLFIQFSSEQRKLKLPFEDLSDGEKCFMISALVVAANKAYGPLFCFWDEPDNYLSLDEVGHFIVSLRKEFQSGGQFIATSHNPETIRQFSDENTLYLQRRSHLEPTTIRKVSELHISGDLVGALTRGDVGNGC